jgi:hypothetical protein
MNAILMVILAAAVPDVTAGPGLADEAVVVEAPVRDVTVFSDRARVRRRANVDMKAGIMKLRLPDLPGAVMMNTVRVECKGARVLRVETIPVQRERFSIEQVEELIDKLEKLTDQLAVLDRETGITSQELGFLQGISPKPPVDESKRVGKPAPPVQVDVWSAVLKFVEERKAVCRSELRKFSQKRREMVKQLQKVQREVQRHNLGAFTDRKIQVVAIAQAKSAVKATIDLEYFVPGANWMPAYDIHFDPDRGRVSIHTAGMVQQATGEAWEEVKMALSTAIPGQGIDLPELLTWALGEKREFIPHARAARWPQKAARFGRPTPQPTIWEAERSAKLQVLQNRLAKLQRLMSTPVDTGTISSLATAEGAFGLRDLGGAGIGSLGSSGRGGYGYGKGAAVATPKPPPRKYKRRPRRPSPRPSSRSSAPSAAPVAMDMEDSYEMVEEESVSRSSRRRRGKKQAQVIQTPLNLFEPTYYRPPRFSDPNLPAVAAGGLDFVYKCPTKITVPSTGKRLRVPLAADTFPVETFYETTPSLMKMAFLKAKVTNKGQRPILKGPANVFVNREFTGQGTLKTTGSGGTIELPLGADENIRILRKVIPQTVTEGVFSKDDITTYTTVIEIGNYKKKSIRILVYDQVPKTRNEDIEIEMSKKSPKPSKGPDADGIMTWDLRIPAGKTRTIKFTYKIERPTNWQLTQ